MTAAPELLEAALIDLTIAAAPFRHGRGYKKRREALDAALHLASTAMKACDMEGIKPDNKTLADLAAEADAEAQAASGWRADVDG